MTTGSPLTRSRSTLLSSSLLFFLFCLSLSAFVQDSGAATSGRGGDPYDVDDDLDGFEFDDDLDYLDDDYDDDDDYELWLRRRQRERQGEMRRRGRGRGGGGDGRRRHAMDEFDDDSWFDEWDDDFFLDDLYDDDYFGYDPYDEIDEFYDPYDDFDEDIYRHYDRYDPYMSDRRRRYNRALDDEDLLDLEVMEEEDLWEEREMARRRKINRSQKRRRPDPARYPDDDWVIQEDDMGGEDLPHQMGGAAEGEAPAPFRWEDLGLTPEEEEALFDSLGGLDFVFRFLKENQMGVDMDDPEGEDKPPADDAPGHCGPEGCSMDDDPQ